MIIEDGVLEPSADGTFDLSTTTSVGDKLPIPPSSSSSTINLDPTVTESNSTGDKEMSTEDSEQALADKEEEEDKEPPRKCSVPNLIGFILIIFDVQLSWKKI